MSEEQKDVPANLSCAEVRGTEGGCQEGVRYEKNEGEVDEGEEIQQHKGEYDADGFYVKGDDSFYEPNGYYFYAEGCDEFGGYYEKVYYVPGPGYEEAKYRKYNELYGEEIANDQDDFEYDLDDYLSEDEFEEYGKEERALKNTDVPQLTAEQPYVQILKEYIIQEDANRLIPISQLINPAIFWLRVQPKSKRFVVKVAGLPIQANASHIDRLLIKKLKKVINIIKNTFKMLLGFMTALDHAGSQLVSKSVTNDFFFYFFSFYSQQILKQ